MTSAFLAPGAFYSREQAAIGGPDSDATVIIILFYFQ
jgi:hypothetical protein